MNVGSLVSARCWSNSIWVIAVLFPGVVFAEEPTLVEFDIDAQELGGALTEFGVQSGKEVYFVGADVAGVQAPSIEGKYFVTDAIQQLLGASGVEYFVDDNGTLLVGTAYAAVAPDQRGDSDSKNLSSTPILMVQNQTSQMTTSSRSEEGQELEDQGSDEERNTRGQIETIVVIGSRNAGIRRYEDDAQPYVVFDGSQIEASAAVDLEEFLRRRLPMDQSRDRSRSTSSDGSNRSRFNLRGLGENQTLVLVNGRRLPSIDIGNVNFAAFAQPDINGIPLSAVERIEVLPATASGIYGGGATGGAINIILKKKYVGADVGLTYENTFDSDSSLKRIDFSGGLSFENGQTNVLVAGSYEDTNPFLYAESDLDERARALIVSNNPSAIFDARTPPRGFTTNIRNADGSNLVLDTGEELGSPITSVPVGYPGASSDGGAAFISNAGTYNLDFPNDQLGQRASLANHPRIYSLSVSARREFTDSLSLFADASIASNLGRAFNRDSSSTIVLPADAPNNPFTTDIRTSVPRPGLGSITSTETETWNALIGARFDISEQWGATIEYSRGESSFDSIVGTSRITPEGFQAMADGTIDILSDLNAFPADLSPYLYPPGTSARSVTLSTTSLRLAGTALELPAGPIKLSGLLEHRSQSTEDSRLTSQGLDFFNSGYEQDVTSGYVEALVPLMLTKRSNRIARSLELQLSGRVDRYDMEFSNDRDTAFVPIEPGSPLPSFERLTSDSSSTEFTAAVRYKPIDDLVLRGSYSTGFIVPTISELVPNTIGNTVIRITDPMRGGVRQTYDVFRVSGGNPDVQPEDAVSKSFGLVYQPSWLDSLTLSIDYVQIEKENEITRVGFDTILEFFPERVTRGPLEPDAPPEYTAGPIIAIDDSSLNLSFSKVEAYDFQVEYNGSFGEIGDFRLLAVATKQNELSQQVAPNAELLNSVGFQGEPVEWRGNLGLFWTRGPISASWNALYYGSYTIYAQIFETNEFLHPFRDRIVLEEGRDTVDSQIYHDVTVLYSFKNDLDLRVGIKNLFEEDAGARASVNATSGRGHAFTDPRYRTYSVAVRKQF